MPVPVIVFDLDGTLVDTAPDLIDTLNAVFALYGLPSVPFRIARNLIGGGVRRFIERAIEANGSATQRENLDEMFVAFVAHYAEHIADRSRPFPGLAGALDALAADGFCFAVCTNKMERLSFRLLDALKLTDRFAAVCGQDTFGIQKPDPDMLLQTIAAAGGTPQRAIMVGDSGIDIRIARAAGVPIIAVDFGYSEQPVAKLGPNAIISHFAQLPAVVAAVSQSD